MEEIINPSWAWDEYKPSPAAPWDLKKVGHLYRRAAFGANWAELQAGLDAGPTKAIAQRLNADGAAFANEAQPWPATIRKATTAPQLRTGCLSKSLSRPAP